MNNKTAFRDIKRQSLSYRDVSQRVKDYGEILLEMNRKSVMEQAARCTNCGIPFCHTEMEYQPKSSGCPLHNLIPEWNELVYYDRYEEAVERLLLTNPFPEFTSRVCPAPCESSCTNGLHGESVAIKTLEFHIQEFGFEHQLIQPVATESSGYTVAIVGSGPAGLSAAHYLSTYGHEVHVYEKDDQPGGLLMYGIPNMKLEKSIVKRRIKLLEQQGVTFHTNVEIGVDQTFDELTTTYDKVIVSVGTQKPRDIAIEGRHLNGVILALEYLKDSIKHPNNPEITAEDKHVVIIGGGDTATDCVATAIRQNARSITQFEITPQKTSFRQSSNPWPQWKDVHTIDYGHEEYVMKHEKDPRIFETTVTSFQGNTHVESVETAHVEWTSSTFSFGDKRTIYPADLVIIAIGFEGMDEMSSSWFPTNGKNGYSSRYHSSVPNVYIAGDARMGQSLVVKAIEEGKQVAFQVHQDIIDGV